MTDVVERRTSPNPPTWRKGTEVVFRFEGKVYSGTFWSRFTPARNAGYHYEIVVDGKVERIFANGPVGRTVTKVSS